MPAARYRFRPAPAVRDTQVNIRVAEPQLARWAKAAHRAGLTQSEFIRQSVDQASTWAMTPPKRRRK